MPQEKSLITKKNRDFTFSFDPATPWGDFFISLAEEGSVRNDRFQNIII
jgi:hypothetical protein